MEQGFPKSIKVYETALGVQLCSDSLSVLRTMPGESIDLIVTSPPFALLREKSYGNKRQEAYVDWLAEFGNAALRTLRCTGSFVIDLGGAYQKGRPIRSLYNYRVLLAFCDQLGYRLAEEFFWYNPAKLPSPIEWVNKRKIRVKDAVNTVWWLSKTDAPKADITRVLTPYSDRMRKLLRDPGGFYKPMLRPSGHDIADRFGEDRGGAIPPNLLQIPNTDSNSYYLRTCKRLGRAIHPARFPVELPAFFIKLLTDEGDTVLDIFSGSNATGIAAERLRRRWISVELDRASAALSAVRFLEGSAAGSVQEAIEALEAGGALRLDAVSPSAVGPATRPRAPGRRRPPPRQQLGLPM